MKKQSRNGFLITRTIKLSNELASIKNYHINAALVVQCIVIVIHSNKNPSSYGFDWLSSRIHSTQRTERSELVNAGFSILFFYFLGALIMLNIWTELKSNRMPDLNWIVKKILTFGINSKIFASLACARKSCIYTSPK